MYHLNLRNAGKRSIYPLGDQFAGISPAGDTIDFTNYYLRGRGSFALRGEEI